MNTDQLESENSLCLPHLVDSLSLQVCRLMSYAEQQSLGEELDWEV